MAKASNPAGPGVRTTTLDARRGKTTTHVERGAQMAAAAHPSRLRILLAFAAVYIIWGSTYLGIKISIETIPPFLMAGLRFFVAGVILYGIARWRGAERPTLRHWRNTALVGSLLFLAGNGALTWSELHVPSGLAALLLSIIPLWMVLLHHLELRLRLGPQLIVGLVLGVAGIGLLVGPQEILGGGRVLPAGAGVLVAGSVCWAIGSLHSRRASMPKSALLTAAMEMITGSVGLCLLALVSGEAQGFSLAAVSTRSVLAVAYLVGFGSLLGFTSYTWLLGVTSPARVATYAYVNPIIAIFIGWALGGESLTARVVVATAVIVSAVALIITHQARSGTARAPAELPPSSECPETVV